MSYPHQKTPVQYGLDTVLVVAMFVLFVSLLLGVKDNFIALLPLVAGLLVTVLTASVRLISN